MRALSLIVFACVACGPPDVESRDDFIQRMERGARAREEAVAEADQREVEASLQAAREQESIRSEVLAELTGQTELDPDAVDERQPMTYEELLMACGRSDDQCVIENLVSGPHNAETLAWLADAYGRLGRNDDRMRILRIRHGLLHNEE